MGEGFLLVAALLVGAVLLLLIHRLRRANRQLYHELRRVRRASADQAAAQAEELAWRRALSAMGDQIAVVVRADKSLTFLTPRARELFGAAVPGEPAIQRLRHHLLDELLDEARRQGEGGSRPIELNERLYLARAAAAPAGGWLFLFLTDVTERHYLARARRDMASNLSHELRTPLTSVRLMSESLLGGALAQPELAARLVGRIAAENEALIRLVEDLTALSWIETERAPLCLEAVALRPLVEQRLARLAPLLESKRIRATVSGDAPTPVLLDPERFGQALTNLLDNAIKFSPDGATVTVLLAQADGATTLAIRDEGPGILPKDLPRIFERFYKGDRVRTRRVGGSGLGLAIARHMVEAHGGTLAAASDFGHGSTFTITLPPDASQGGSGV